MKGKDCFTAAEADAIRDLLKQVRRADRPMKKVLRSTLRKRYRFWITDFDNRGRGFDVTDFDAVVASGRITVENSNTPRTAAPADLGDKPKVWQEELRAHHKPDKVRVLFVGESPPKGGTFFYQADSLLYHAFKEAFDDPDDFLAEFQSRGFFLDDLVPFPVNKMSNGEREAARCAHIDNLSALLLKHHPEAVVSVMKAIQPHIAEALYRANLSVPHYNVPFPRPEHRRRFVKEIRSLLRQWSR